MKFNSFFKSVLLATTLVFFISCDKDFNEIGADFVDSDHYDFLAKKFDVIAYNQALTPVQTNNLPINALGFYNNEVFGKTQASFVTQLELASINPKFYKLPINIQVDSVYLHVPYFSRLTATDANGDSTYELDAKYGAGKIKLEVFRSNYYLRNLDANPISGLLEQQSYFSDQKLDIEGVTPTSLGDRLNDLLAPSTQNDDFEFSPNQIKFLKTDPATNLPVVPNVVRERLVPGIYMDLKKDVFKTAIIEAGATNLADNNVFKNYFRGIYFKAANHSTTPNSGSLSMLNFAQGKIVIVYKDDKSATDTTPTRRTITLNMRGFSVNLLENSANGTPANTKYNTALTTANTTTGDETLFLKGGTGSMAIIDLFNKQKNNISADLNTMRAEKWLINEANLVFNIDHNNDGMGAISATDIITQEPSRIYLYDFTNKRPLIDYYYDSSTSTNPKFNKLTHGGIIEKVSENDRGTKYKIRITNHIRNLVKYGGALNADGVTFNPSKDSTNVKLGLVITENINSVANLKVKNPFSYIETNPNTGFPEVKSAKYLPASSVITPLGTVLYGSSASVPLSKRLQLEIIYTKPDQN